LHPDAPECVLWDIASRQVIRRFPLPGVTRSLAWTRDEGALLTGRGVPWSGGPGSRGASVFLFDSATGVEIHRFGNELFGVNGMALSPDGSLALVSGMLGETRAAGSSLELWELASGRLAHQIARVEDSAQVTLPYFTSVAFTPDGRLIVAGCVHFVFPTRVGKFQPEPPWWWNRCLRVWSAHDHQEFDLIRHHSPVVGLSVSSDSRRLFAAGDRLTVWSLADGKELWDRRSFIDHLAAVSADGRLIARGVGHREDNHGPYIDTAVELYDGNNGEFVALGLHRTTPTSFAFAQSVLVAGGEEGELRFWAI
jgi:WD40 repeat protein